MHAPRRNGTPHDTFFRNYEPNGVLEMCFSYIQNMPFYFSSGKQELSICSFLEYCYTVVFVHDISCPLQKHVWFGV